MERFKMVLLGLCFSLSGFSASAQQSDAFNEIENKLSQNPKNIIIKFYTDWCGICAIQDQKIRKNKQLESMLENDFYFVEFNTESKESIVFHGIRFENKQGRTHSFAQALLENPDALPAWVILNPDYEIIFQYNGLLEPEELILVLTKIYN